MPDISFAGHSQPRQTGFTLLEVLVVVFIIAMTTSLAVVTLGRDEQSQVDQQARQLLADFAFARDLALHQHRLVGWHPDADGYHFSQRDSRGRWQKHTSRALPERHWPEHLQLQEKPQGLQEDSLQQEKKTENSQPGLVFFPSGEVTPATLTLAMPAGKRRIRVQAQAFELLERVQDD